MDIDTWFVKIASRDCPYSGGQRSMVPWIKWCRERCFHSRHPKLFHLFYPKCSKDDCPMKIEEC